MSFSALPTVNAFLNGTAATLLVAGFLLIRSGRREAHRRVMVSAFACSALFLVSYLVYHAGVGSVRFRGTGTVPTVYLGILLTHTLLAAAVPFLAVAAVSVLAQTMPGWVVFASLNVAFGAVLYGFVAGSALLALFRHGASLGGIGILALYVQDRTGWRAGWVQMGFDIVLFAAAFALRDPVSVLWSLLGALVLNLVIAINHRRDRYIAA